MLIEFKCPHFKTILQVPGDFTGKEGKCPRCKKEVIVPTKQKRTPENATVFKIVGKKF